MDVAGYVVELNGLNLLEPIIYGRDMPIDGDGHYLFRTAEDALRYADIWNDNGMFRTRVLALVPADQVAP